MQSEDGENRLDRYKSAFQKKSNSQAREIPRNYDLERPLSEDRDALGSHFENAEGEAHQQKKLQIRRAVEEALLMAQKMLGSVIHPYNFVTLPLSEARALGVDPASEEFDLEASVENSFGPGSEPWVTLREHRSQPLVLIMDASLSIADLKLQLTAAALALVLIQFARDPLGVVAFESEAHEIKKPEDAVSPRQSLEKFFALTARGYTHLEKGLKKALEVTRAIRTQKRQWMIPAILITDGKYTAGKNPVDLGRQFPRLHVLKMGSDQAGRPVCEDLARLGKGSYSEILAYSALPQALHRTVKGLLRART